MPRAIDIVSIGYWCSSHICYRHFPGRQRATLSYGAHRRPVCSWVDFKGASGIDAHASLMRVALKFPRGHLFRLWMFLILMSAADASEGASSQQS